METEEFTAVSLSKYLADDMRAFGEMVFTSKLVNGEYHMNSASVGTSKLA